MKKGFFTAKQAREKLGVARNTWDRWEAKGKLPRPRIHPMNRYRLYSDEDLSKIKLIIEEASGQKRGAKMNIINGEVKYLIPAKKITPALWDVLKKECRRSYKKIQQRIAEVGSERVTIGFDKDLRPVCEQVRF
ncbi:MAG: MerR family transcriptional regulator [Candidatus Omnitrophota bacterium]